MKRIAEALGMSRSHLATSAPRKPRGRSARVGGDEPAYSPESNGMVEAFVKTFKRDYGYRADLPNTAAVLELLGGWFDDDNENHSHKGLNMLLPKEFRRAKSM